MANIRSWDDRHQWAFWDNRPNARQVPDLSIRLVLRLGGVTARPMEGIRMAKSISKKFFSCLVMAICSLFQPCSAQQTIFNVPSGDVTPKGHLYEEHESQFRPWHPNAFWDLTHYNAFGIGHNTELDATVLNVSSPPSNNVSLGLGFKSNLPLYAKKLPQRELKMTYGALFPISFQGQGVGNWEYAQLNGRLPKLKTRLTAGVSVGSKAIFGRNAVSFIGGYEQPVTRRLSLIGDYFSGTNNLGLFIPGFSYAFPKDTTLFLGYQIPNNSRCGHSGIVFELSKLF